MFFGIESRLCSSGDAEVAVAEAVAVVAAADAVADRGDVGDAADAVADLAEADIAEALAAADAVAEADARRFVIAGRAAVSYRSLSV